MKLFNLGIRNTEQKIDKLKSAEIMAKRNNDVKNNYQKIRLAWIGLGVVTVGMITTILLYWYQVSLQKRQNEFQQALQRDQLHFQQQLDYEKFKYEIVQGTMPLGSNKKRVEVLEFYKRNGFLKGDLNFYESMSSERNSSSHQAKIKSGSIFNTDPEDEPTVLVSNSTKPCDAGPSNGCWVKSINARVGDTVGVQIYFHNCSKYVAHAVAVGMNPEYSSFGKIHLLKGVIAEDNGIVRGSARVATPDPAILTFIPGSVRLYRNQSLVPYSIKGERYLFSSNGINIGDIEPGWNGQGIIVADYKVVSRKS